MSDKKRAPNFSVAEKILLLNIIADFKNVVENKQTNSETWREKSDTWKKISDIFNSQSQTEYPRTSEALKKYYDNIKKTIRKEVADEKKEIQKTGGGKAEIKDNPIKELALGIMNKKTVYGLENRFDCGNGAPGTSESVIDDNIIIEYVAEPNVTLNLIKPLADYNYIESHCEQSMTTQSTPKNKRKRPSECLNSWSKKRRPAIQQLSSSQLSEEYLKLALIKQEYFQQEKERMLLENQWEKELFELKKQKLMLDIKLREQQLEARDKP